MSSPATKTDQTTTADGFYDEIVRQLVNSVLSDEEAPSHCGMFFPLNSLELLVPAMKVREILQSIPELNKTDIPVLAQHVTEHAKQVFLILGYTGQVKQIKSLQEANFTDQDLPIRSITIDNTTKVCRVGEPGQTTEKYLDRFPQWERRNFNEFAEKQWLFMARKFLSSQFEYDFLSKFPLPFAPGPDTTTYSGLSGDVQQLRLHVGHLDDGHKQSLLPFTAQDYVLVALKHFKMRSELADVNKFYDREKQTLKLMNDLNHPHLVKSIAAFRRGKGKFFLFPWAQGGNLRHFWQSCDAGLDEDLVSWAVRQMRGISDGLRELHHGNGGPGGTRHGDLKPENILLFTTESTDSRWGNLVVADVGLAKFHPDYTQERPGPTTNKHWSLLYSPPETSYSSTKGTLSRRYDVWGLGCIFLQFVIWIIHGPKQLNKFGAEFGNQKEFWTDGTDGRPQMHSRVSKAIDDILNTDLKADSPLRQLVQLINDQLLVLDWEKRAKTKEVVGKLDEILESCSKESYRFGPDLLELAKNRSSDTGATRPTQSSVSKEVSQGSKQLGG